MMREMLLRISLLFAFSVVITFVNASSPATVVWFGYKSSKKPVQYDYLKEILPSSFKFANHSDSPGAVVCERYDDVADIEKLLKEHKIPVLIHLPEESKGISMETMACSRIYSKFDLVLRQYAYMGKAPPNVVHIPLGYVINMLRDSDNKQHHSSVKYAEWSLSRGVDRRSYRWSFVGGDDWADKSSLDPLKAWAPYFNQETSIQETRFVYNQSLFAVVGREGASLDSMRVYEAIIGAFLSIPVDFCSFLSICPFLSIST